MENVRIGVYNICKNESKFVKDWVKSVWNNGNGADGAYILDTGSTDDTVDMFKQTVKDMGIPKGWLKIKKKTYKQFRFDTARNDNLDMIPEDSYDVLVSVDLDERFIPDFWKDLRDIVKEHPDFSYINYLYAWNHDEDGYNGRVFWYSKVHPPKGYRYKGAVHEWPENAEPEKYQYGEEYFMDSAKAYLHHYPDKTKSRGQYLPLLKIRCEENPDDISALVYLAREYFANDNTSMEGIQAAVQGYIKCCGYSDGSQYEIKSALAQYIAEAYAGLGMRDEAEFYFRKAIETHPYSRDPYLVYAFFKAYGGDPATARSILYDMEHIAIEPVHSWYELDYDWTWRPLHVKAVIFCWEGMYAEALETFKKAENLYITTEKDRSEAEANGFYNDYGWLKERMGIKETDASE